MIIRLPGFLCFTTTKRIRLFPQALKTSSLESCFSDFPFKVFKSDQVSLRYFWSSDIPVGMFPVQVNGRILLDRVLVIASGHTLHSKINLTLKSQAVSFSWRTLLTICFASGVPFSGFSFFLIIFSQELWEINFLWASSSKITQCKFGRQWPHILRVPCPRISPLCKKADSQCPCFILVSTEWEFP